MRILGLEISRSRRSLRTRMEQLEQRVKGEQTWFELFREQHTPHSDVEVNADTVRRLGSAWAAASRLAQTIAQVSLFVNRRLEDGTERAPDHPLYPLLHDAPNPQMSSFQFREALTLQRFFWGAAYAQIVWNSVRSRVLEIWPLLAWKMKVERTDGRLRYLYRPKTGGETIELQPYQVLHIAGASYNGVHALDPMDTGREVFGNAIAAERFTGDYWKNGASPSGALKLPYRLETKEQRDRLRDSVREKHQEWGEKGEIMLLEQNTEWQQIGIDPQASQLIEHREHEITNIARWAGMQPHMIADLRRATFSNITEQSIEYVRHTVMPEARRWEDAIKLRCFTPAERESFFAEFELNSLMRGSFRERVEAYQLAIQSSWITPNEVRKLENLNPIEGADKLLMPLNFIQLNSDGTAPATMDEPDMDEDDGDDARSREQRQADARGRYAQNALPSFIAQWQRVVNDEVRQIRDKGLSVLTSRDAAQFGTWLEDFYAGRSESTIRTVQPAYAAAHIAMRADAAQELGIDEDGIGSADYDQALQDYLRIMGDERSAQARRQIEQLLGEPDPDALIRSRLDEWTEKRAQKVGLDEAFRATNAFAVAAYRASGLVSKLRWVARGSKSCPYCQRLDGRVVGIRQSFLDSGDFQPEGADRPLRVFSKVKHPPSHGGCVCVVVAERGR